MQLVVPNGILTSFSGDEPGMDAGENASRQVLQISLQFLDLFSSKEWSESLKLAFMISLLHVLAAPARLM